jgi:hypothetical protein
MVRVALLLMPLSEAETPVDPDAFAVTSPVALTLAIDEAETAHVTLEFTLAVEPSLYFAVALNCCVAPVAILAVAGDTEIDDNVLVGVLVELTPLHPVLAMSNASDRNTKRYVGRK